MNDFWNNALYYYMNTPKASPTLGINSYNLARDAGLARMASAGFALRNMSMLGAAEYMAGKPIEAIYDSMGRSISQKKVDTSYIDNSNLPSNVKSDAYRMGSMQPTFWNFY